MSREENKLRRNQDIAREFQVRYTQLQGKAQSRTDVIVHELALKYYLSPDWIRHIIMNTILPEDEKDNQTHHHDGV